MSFSQIIVDLGRPANGGESYALQRRRGRRWKSGVDCGRGVLPFTNCGRDGSLRPSQEVEAVDVHECIRERRSVRKYESDPVPEEALTRVLEAVQWAPSWVNFQPWEVVIVDDPEVKERLQGCVPEGNPGRKAVTAAPIILAVCGRKGISGYYQGTPSTPHGDWVMFDLGIACQNLCLAAHAEGLGTLHLGLLDQKRAAEVLGLPDGVELFELIPLGVPAKRGRAPKRKAIEEFTHRNRFGA